MLINEMESSEFNNHNKPDEIDHFIRTSLLKCETIEDTKAKLYKSV